jgi:glycine cleavage system H protein
MPNGESETKNSSLPAGASGALIFMMGKFEARIPRDRNYARNHMWSRNHAGHHRFGFSSYAVRLLQDVYFLEWSIDAGSMVRFRQEIGSIESSKAESALYAPMPGVIIDFNQALLSDPSAINVDNYGAGWLFEMEGEASSLFDAAQYVDHLAEVWEETQRTIKGQLR